MSHRRRVRAAEEKARKKSAGSSPAALWVALAGLALIAGGTLRLSTGLLPILFGQPLSGTIVEVRADPMAPSGGSVLTVELEVPGGRRLRIERPVSSDPSVLDRLFSTDPSYAVVGRPVALAGFEGAPEQAQLKHWRAHWVAGAVLVLFGVVVMAAGLQLRLAGVASGAR